MNKNCLLFPGQGSQYVGMAKSFLQTDEGKQLAEKAESLIGLPLTEYMLNGPKEDLTKTSILQPAILLHSTLAFRALKNFYPDLAISFAVGHSLGEYSALVAANVVCFDDAIKIVHLRGKLMQDAVPQGIGAMAAVLGLAPKIIQEALLEYEDKNSSNYVTVANFNGPAQTVISGTAVGVKNASDKLKNLGARKIISLPVSAPFHCALMEKAQNEMANYLSSIKFNDPDFPIVSTVTAGHLDKGDDIKKIMLKQITSPVLFTGAIEFVKSKVPGNIRFFEVGPGSILGGIVQRIDNSFKITKIDCLEDISNV